MPDTSANFCSFLSPVETDRSIVFNILETELPPAAASIPNEDNAVDNPNTSLELKPTILPATPNLVAIFIISASVVENLFPKSTIVEPKRE